MAQSGNITTIHHHSMSDLMCKTVDRIDELYHKGSDFTAIPSGFTDFIGKYRYGPEGVVKLKFMGEYCKFEDNLYSFNDN